MLPASRRPRRLARVIRPERADPDEHAHVGQGRERGHDLLDGGRRRHGRGQVVVDEQGRGRDERGHAPEVRLGDRVRAAPVRIGDAYLSIAEGHDHQQAGDGDRDGHRELQGGQGGPTEDEGEDDLLGRVRARGDGVRAEDGQRLGLGQAFAELLVLVERAAQEHAADLGQGSAAGRGRDAGRFLGRQRALARVPEVRRVGAFDADPPVARLAALERPTAADHRPTASRSMSRGGSPTACIAAWTAAMS